MFPENCFFSANCLGTVGARPMECHAERLRDCFQGSWWLIKASFLGGNVALIGGVTPLRFLMKIVFAQIHK